MKVTKTSERQHAQSSCGKQLVILVDLLYTLDMVSLVWGDVKISTGLDLLSLVVLNCMV